MTAQQTQSSTVATPHICTGCGLTCDDVLLGSDGTGSVTVAPPCPLAAVVPQPGGEESAKTRIAGRPVDSAEAIHAAAEILAAARSPLLTGLQRATVETIRAAIALADQLGGVIDPIDAAGASHDATAAQSVGMVTATFGDVAARADLVVSWFADFDATHPRWRERLVRNAQARIVELDAGPAGTLRSRNAAVVLRAILLDAPLRAEAVEQTTGRTLAAWRELAAALTKADYVAILFDELTLGGEAAAALAELVVAVHRRTRCVAVPLGRPGNAAGAVQTLLWQTGFPAAVTFADGYPEYRPDEGTAERLLERGEVDGALVVGADPLGPASRLSSAAQATLRRIPLVVLDDAQTATMAAAQVAIAVPRFELSEAGTVFRADGVALPLTAAIVSPLESATDVLIQLAREIAARLTSVPVASS